MPVYRSSYKPDIDQRIQAKDYKAHPPWPSDSSRNFFLQDTKSFKIPSHSRYQARAPQLTLPLLFLSEGLSSSSSLFWGNVVSNSKTIMRNERTKHSTKGENAYEPSVKPSIALVKGIIGGLGLLSVVLM
jgi:hypothetical protein